MSPVYVRRDGSKLLGPKRTTQGLEYLDVLTLSLVPLLVVLAQRWASHCGWQEEPVSRLWYGATADRRSPPTEEFRRCL